MHNFIHNWINSVLFVINYVNKIILYILLYYFSYTSKEYNRNVFLCIIYLNHALFALGII